MQCLMGIPSLRLLNWHDGASVFCGDVRKSVYYSRSRGMRFAFLNEQADAKPSRAVKYETPSALVQKCSHRPRL
jgi:hypothetical protein